MSYTPAQGSHTCRLKREAYAEYHLDQPKNILVDMCIYVYVCIYVFTYTHIYSSS